MNKKVFIGILVGCGVITVVALMYLPKKAKSQQKLNQEAIDLIAAIDKAPK